nr:hypothetical protein [Tanacetum cinerariifolium]
EVDHNDSEEKEHLVDKLIQKFNHKIAKCQKHIKKSNQQSKDLENQNKDLQEKYNVLINQVNTFEEKNNEFDEQIKVLNKKNADLLAQTEVLQDQLKVKHVVFDTHTEFQAQYAKLKEERYEYMIRYSALCDNEKKHRKKIDEQEILFEKMSRQLVEMNNNVLRLQEKIIEKEMKILELEGCVSNKDVEIEKCLERLNEYLDTFSSVRRPKHSGVIWKKKGSSNTSNVDLSSVSLLKLNKDVKRYSRKDLLSCNNSHLEETSSAYVCNDAMNVFCNSRMCDLFDENNLYIFNDESVRISPVSKMPFRKKPHDSLNVRSKRNSNKSLPGIVHRGLPKMQLLAEPVAKWFSRVEHCPDLSLDHRFRMLKAYDRCYLLNDYEDVGKLKVKGDIRVFVGYSKESAAFKIYNKQTRKIHESMNENLQIPSVSKVSEASKKDLEDLFQNFYDEYFDSSKIMKSSTTNVETLINEKVFHESISNNMIPNVDEASTSHNVFNERWENAYFDATLRDADWVSTMQEELDQFARLKVWRLVPRPEDHVYALDKALYGLKQVPRAWYDVLSRFLIDSGFQKVPTPMVEQAKLKLDLVGKPVDHTDYRSTCDELDAFVSIPDEGDMAFLRKNVKYGAAVGKLVLLQVSANLGVFFSYLVSLLIIFLR